MRVRVRFILLVQSRDNAARITRLRESSSDFFILRRKCSARSRDSAAYEMWKCDRELLFYYVIILRPLRALKFAQVLARSFYDKKKKLVCRV